MYVSRLEFEQRARDLSAKIKQPIPEEEPIEEIIEEPSPPAPEVDDSISEADPKFADYVYKLPDGIEREEPRYSPSRPIGGMDRFN